MRKPLILGGILVGVVIALVVWRRTPGEPPHPDPVVTSAGSAARAAPAVPPEPASRRVRRLGSEERKQLGAQIVAARERYRAETASHAGDVPSLVNDTIRFEQVSATVKAALAEAIPLLAECYGDQPAGATATVTMTMISDPDLGTVIDTAVPIGADGHPVTSEQDDCLRTAIEALALPPLEVGGRLPLQYSFVFD